MTDETRPDRDALATAIHATGAVVNWREALTAADAVLALIPAPHPQGVPIPADYTQIVADLLRQRDALMALRHGIGALIETYEDTSAVPNDRLRALLAVAPAPTEGEQP